MNGCHKYFTNKLASITNTASGSAVTYASYTYDGLGQLTIEDTQDPAQKKYIRYDVTGKVTAVARDADFDDLVVEYVYDELGQRIVKKTYNSSHHLIQNTYYVGDVIYTQPVVNDIPGTAVVQEYEIDGGNGRIGIYYRQSGIYAYQLTDHLGNVRAVVAKSSGTLEVRLYNDYYPFGMTITPGTTGSNDYRYGYQGQYAEKDPETDWNAFELRMYDSRIARWLSVDPKGQFHSPYVAMGNNPLKGVDPDGGKVTTTIVDKNNRILDVINDGKDDIIRLNDVDYNFWDDYIKREGTSIFREWALEDGELLKFHTLFGGTEFLNTDDANGGWRSPEFGSSIFNDIPGWKGVYGKDFVADLSKAYFSHSPLSEFASLGVLAFDSRNDAPLDIKSSMGLDRHAGIRWDENTITSMRALGNILFGKNLAAAKSFFSNKYLYYARTMAVVGLYNQIKNDGNGYNSGWPFFGEHTLSGSAIYYGFWGKKY